MQHSSRFQFLKLKQVFNKNKKRKPVFQSPFSEQKLVSFQFGLEQIISLLHSCLVNLKLFLSSQSQTSFQSHSKWCENNYVSFPAGLQQAVNPTKIRVKIIMFLFQLVSNKLAKQMWWQNKKTQLAIGGGAVLLILLIIIIICCS